MRRRFVNYDITVRITLVNQDLLGPSPIFVFPQDHIMQSLLKLNVSDMLFTLLGFNICNFTCGSV